MQYLGDSMALSVLDSPICLEALDGPTAKREKQIDRVIVFCLVPCLEALSVPSPHDGSFLSD
jgi:hypothetical protein